MWSKWKVLYSESALIGAKILDWFSMYVLKSTTIPRKGQCPHIEYMRHIRCLFAVTVESLVRLAFYIMKDSVSRCMSCTWFGIWCQIFVHTHSLFTLGTLLIHGRLYRWTENSFPFFLYLKPVEIPNKCFIIIWTSLKVV